MTEAKIIKRIKEIQYEMTLLKIKPYEKIKRQRHKLLQEESELKMRMLR